MKFSMYKFKAMAPVMALFQKQPLLPFKQDYDNLRLHRQKSALGSDTARSGRCFHRNQSAVSTSHNVPSDNNAIEGALETDTPTISFAMINNIGSVTIIILNNYIKHNIPYYDLKKISISTKGKNRGIGLHNAENILSKYPNIVHDTEMKDHEFIQRLEIFK